MLVVNLDMLTRDNILFNAFKHHAGFVRKCLSEQDQETFFNHLKTIGNCQLDFYYGSLSIESVGSQIIEHLASLGVDSFKSYQELLDQHDHYHTLVLSDDSGWVVRMGKVKEKFIHVHPARNSPHTLRITASAMKTALAIIYRVNNGAMYGYELDAVNAMRHQFLSLPPVKKLEDLKAVERIKRIVVEQIRGLAFMEIKSGNKENYEGLVIK